MGVHARGAHHARRRGAGAASGAAACGLVALALTAAPAVADTQSFATPGCSTWTAPTGIYGAVSIQATGSAGGQGQGAEGAGGAGGMGDRISADLSGVSAGQALRVCVDVGGGAVSTSNSGLVGGHGGGASGVSLGSDFSNPIVIAAGGGGGGGGGNGDAGGGAGNAGGGNGSSGSAGYVAGGGGSGGTSTSGGTGGVGGYPNHHGVDGSGSTSAAPGAGGYGSDDYPAVSGGGGGGGGAGYWGGGGGGTGWDAGGGGGGGGSDLCASSSTLTGCAVDAGAGTQTTAGDSAGDAQVVIGYSVAQSPTVSITTPSAGATYAVGQTVTSDFTCTEGQGGPGLNSCLDQNGNPSGTALDTSTPGVFVFTAKAISSDGFSGYETLTYTIAAPPMPSIATPSQGATYTLNEVVDASYSCSEGAFGPGLLLTGGCVGTVPDGSALDTSTAGLHTFTVTAASQDGQTGTASAQYDVGYAFGGFLPPVNNPPAVNTGRSGRTYPVKFQLTDANGQYISTLAAVQAIGYTTIDCSALTDTSSVLETTATGSTTLRYDSTDNQYVYNWATPTSAGCYKLTVTLDSGQKYYAYFHLS